MIDYERLERIWTHDPSVIFLVEYVHSSLTPIIDAPLYAILDSVERIITELTDRSPFVDISPDNLRSVLDLHYERRLNAFSNTLM